jgi:D-alanyl-D-alanine carboxypeptidase/D-alanyl-D-alanine-endopeptidase (penicillin-binding protein 4)
MNVLVIVKAATFVCMKFPLWLSFFVLCFLYACSPAKQIGKSAKEKVLNDPALETAHVGISLYEPATGKYWYNYQGDKYFVPASNTKLPTCYAAMKYLGDSLVGLTYDYFDEHTITFFPSGDPTFLHSDFKSQPVLDFLRSKGIAFHLNNTNWNEDPLGSGWSWNDYNSDYMAERSAFPLAGNTVKFKLAEQHFLKNEVNWTNELDWVITPSYFSKKVNNYFQLPLKEQGKRIMQDSIVYQEALQTFSLKRKLDENWFNLQYGGSRFTHDEIPFVTNNDTTAVEILRTDYLINIKNGGLVKHHDPHGKNFVIHSQPTDSLLKPMMHRSDNFFAEQSLLMVSNERLGYMNDAKIIDTLLKTDFKDLPQNQDGWTARG